MRFRITCPRCDGEGKLPLSPELVNTLLMFPRSGTVTAAQLHDLTPIGNVTAYNNRLVDLFLLGLVTREKSGKSWLYSRA